MGMRGHASREIFAADDPRFSAALDERILEMRRLLLALEPESTASALQALRRAFPDTPFEERIRALSELRH